jgi:hypothetical protein
MNSSSQHPESAESGEWVFGGKLRRMPAPETANWLELYGSWVGFVEAVHESIGGRRGSGVVRFAKREDGGGDHDLQSRRASLNVTL